MNTDRHHSSDGTQSYHGRRDSDMGTASVADATRQTRKVQSTDPSSPSVDPLQPDIHELVRREHGSRPREAATSVRKIGINEMRQLLGTREGEELFIKILINRLEILARDGKWERMKWLPTSETLWWRVPEHIREGFLRWTETSTFSSNPHTPFQGVAVESTEGTQVAATTSAHRHVASSDSDSVGTVPIIPIPAFSEPRDKKRDSQDSGVILSTPDHNHDRPDEPNMREGQSLRYNERENHPVAPIQPDEPIVDSNSEQIVANDGVQLSEPLERLNNIYRDGKQSRCHGSRQKEVDRNHGPWLQMTGKDTEEWRKKRAQAKAAGSSSSGGKKRTRETDDSGEGSKASAKKKKSGKASANITEGDVSGKSGHDGRTVTGIETLNKTPNDTTASSDVGEGPSTGAAQALSFGPHEG